VRFFCFAHTQFAHNFEDVDISFYLPSLEAPIETISKLLGTRHAEKSYPAFHNFKLVIVKMAIFFISFKSLTQR
jgi:hypothetical protein